MLDVEEEQARPVLRLGLEADREAAGGGVGDGAGPDGSVHADYGGGGRSVGEVLGDVSCGEQDGG